MFSQWGEAGEVQLVLASGQSFCAPCLSKHHPRVHKQEHFPSPGPPCYPLYPVSKLTLCHVDTLSTAHHLLQVS